MAMELKEVCAESERLCIASDNLYQLVMHSSKRDIIMVSGGSDMMRVE